MGGKGKEAGRAMEEGRGRGKGDRKRKRRDAVVMGDKEIRKDKKNNK